MKSRQGWAELFCLRGDARERHAAVPPALSAASLGDPVPTPCGRERKLPSTRELAAQLGVSRSAAVAAYEQLLAEGYTSGRHGSGTYISPDLPEPIEANAARRRKHAAPVAVQCRAAADLRRFRRRHVQDDERPFNLGRTLVDARTAELWRRLSARTFRGLDAEPLLDIPTRAARSNLRTNDLRLSAGGARGAMRSRTDRGHGGNAAGASTS